MLIRITVKKDNMPAIKALTSKSPTLSKEDRRPMMFSLVLRALCRFRTYVPGFGEGCRFVYRHLLDQARCINIAGSRSCMAPHLAHDHAGEPLPTSIYSARSPQPWLGMVAGVLYTDAVRLGREAAQRLALSGVCEVRPGLTDREFTWIESEYGIEFADDHRAFLAAGLPINSARPEDGATWEQPWPDWRDGEEEELRLHVGWPVRVVLHDVEHGAWLRSWGARPASSAEALRIAGQELAREPKLIPVYGHRFLPGGRGTYGGQVLSIWGTDIISYGRDLAEYITNDFYPLDEDAGPWEKGDAVPVWGEFLPQAQL